MPPADGVAIDRLIADLDEGSRAIAAIAEIYLTAIEAARSE